MAKFNILTKKDKQKEYIITDMIATKLTEKKFLELKKLNSKILGEYDFVKFENTDFSWWGKISKYLTATKITRANFEIDFFGNVEKY